MASSSSIAVVLTTVGSEEQAAGLVRQLLEERLIACSTVISSVASHYWWDGKITSETEALLVIKTRSDVVDRLKARVLELHPYTVPEFIVLDASNVAEAYAAWIDATIKSEEN
jgi:periplasmic divalent cation tolerance protein